MADITLSKAVRSNLLNLQSTANLMGKTQERLATGLRVNSALDNPTNFFTASALNSRAGDLGLLLDSVSNAVQTLAAADKGITAITKLVESAQATARQALQTAATVDQTTVTGGSPASSASVTAGAFSALDVSGTGSAAEAATITAGAFSAVDVSETGQVATQSTITAANLFNDIDLTNHADDALTFDITLGGDTLGITIDRTADGDADNIIDIGEAVAAIQAQLDAANGGLGFGVTVGDDGAGRLTFTADAAGATALTVDNAALVDGDGLGGIAAAISDLGIDDPDGVGQTDTGDALVNAAEISFTLSVDGADTTVTLNATTMAAFDNTADLSDLSAEDIAAFINDAVSSNVASVNDDGDLVFTSTSDGDDSTLEITGFAASDTVGGSTGIANQAEVTGADAVAADSLSFTLDVNGTEETITIDAATVAAFDNSLDASALTAENIAAIINDQFGSEVASVNDDGNLEITSSTTGTASTVEISGFTASVSGGSTGIANATDTGDAAVAGTPSTETVVNPKRAELVGQYNELLTQIDDLTKDAGFNGVNLLQAGTTLSVLFNEDGSSKLDITGVDFSAQGLGLAGGDLVGGIADDAFDTNDSINEVLASLKGGIETLRTQASKFGSNLSVVETRQDFTKNMINVLQTGAASLTLADTNEEAANLLALQTRQQLSSTALSLASQADQQVLRLF